MSIDTTTSSLPALVPFTEQHEHIRAPFYVRPSSAWVQDCLCGATVKIPRHASESHPPSVQAVLDAFDRHCRDAARLTPEQCRVLRAAEGDFAGMLPSPVAHTTLRPLVARGLAVYVGPLRHRRGQITGRGRGVLAEHDRRSA